MRRQPASLLAEKPDMLMSCKFGQLVNIKEGLGLLKLADTVLILIDPSPSKVKISSFQLVHCKFLPHENYGDWELQVIYY